MSKHFEELSKELASGVSRRKAFLRFGAGLGAAALGLFSRRRAQAEGIGELCDAICKATDNCGCFTHGQCVSRCVHLGPDVACSPTVNCI